MHFRTTDESLKQASVEGVAGAYSNRARLTKLRALLLALVIAVPQSPRAQTPAQPPLALEGKIPLGSVSGRIDHLAIDLKRQRLFVAELGNNSVGIVDLATRKVLQTVTGFREPQGVGYEPTTDTVYVANAGDGSVHVLRGDNLAPVGRIDLGSDADNVRIDPVQRQVLVGYGDGGLAVIDPQRRAKLGEMRLAAHPEGFQLLEGGTRAVVNLPEAHRIAIADLSSGSTTSFSTGALSGNFPMAIDSQTNSVLAGFRNPPMLAAYALPEGRVLAKVPICADTDDLFVDAKRHWIYVSCGSGVIDVVEAAGDGYRRVAQVTTASGGRTSLFVPELDRLFVAVRAGWSEPAAIWVFHPTP